MTMAATNALIMACQCLAGGKHEPAELGRGLIRVIVERISWRGKPDLGVDVSLGEVDEDLLLDAVADFLWANRPR